MTNLEPPSADPSRTIVRRWPLLVALFLLGAPDLRAQDAPEGWTTVTDAADADSVTFVAMAPGWHLYPGPAALVYEPTVTADEPFRVEYEAYRFPGGTSGYGIFLGGKGLEPNTYDFFEVLLDAEGRYRIGHQAPGEFHVVVPWTAHEAIAVPAAEENGHNVLVVEVTDDRFTVRVNGEEVASFEPPDYARFDGVVGLRVLGGANVHVTRLDVSSLEAAPEPDGKPAADAGR